LKFDSIDVQHLLLGFIVEDQGSGYLHMRKILVVDEPTDGEPTWGFQQQANDSFLDRETVDRLRSMFSFFGPRPECQPTHGNMPLTAGARMVLGDAFEHAGGSTVSPLHLLWAMFAEQDGPAATSLKENGVTRERVENEIGRRDAR
jgi:hypothetical protein